MGSDSSLQGQGPRPIETPRQAIHARQPKCRTRQLPPPHPLLSRPPLIGVSPELQLELERLRAERDALAAELQIERAERLRAEERLRLSEREKLEQMREGAASREKLASELEEARLRAMRAEARQAALDADLRLSEIAERRRGSPSTDADRDASRRRDRRARRRSAGHGDEPSRRRRPKRRAPRRFGSGGVDGRSHPLQVQPVVARRCGAESRARGATDATSATDANRARR